MPGIDETADVPEGDRSRLNWADLQLFHAIAEHGTFTAAARVLRISQPTVSLRAKELEDRIGAQLFVRNTTGVTLTEAGKQIRLEVQSMNRSASKIGNMIADRDRHDKGRVRLRCTDGIATFWLAPRIAQLQRSYPEILLTLDVGLWQEDPVTPEVEVCIQYEKNTNPDNIVIPIGTAHYLAFASRSYLDIYGTPKSIPELAQHRAIRHTGQGGRQEDAWDPKLAALWTLWGNQLETNCSPAVLQAAQGGAGLALLPSTVALFAPDLVPLEPAPIVSLTKWLVYHRDVANIARVRRVVDWIKEIYDPRTNPWFRDEFIHPSEFADLSAATVQAQPSKVERMDRGVVRR